MEKPYQKQLAFTDAEITAQMIAAAARLAEQISETKVLQEIVVNQRTFAELGEELFPDVHVNIAQMAASYAARAVLRPEELEEIRERNRSAGGTKGALTFMPEGYVLDGQHEPLEEKTDWAPQESQRLLELAANPACQYSNGMHKGKPCFRLLCDILNKEFHEGERIRNMNSCARKWKRLLQERNGEAEA